MTKTEMVDRVLDALGIEERILEGLAQLKGGLDAGNVNYDQAEFKKFSSSMLSEAIGAFRSEYEQRFSEEEMGDVLKFLDTSSGRKFVVEMIKIQRDIAQKNVMKGGPNATL